MDEEHAVNLHNGVQCPQQLAVSAVAPKARSHLEKSKRWLFPARLVGGRGAFDRGVAQVCRSRGDERGVLARRYVPQISQHPHDFMVAEQLVHRTAGAGRVLLQPLQQIERLRRIWPAIDDVAELNQMRASTCPAQSLVEKTGGFQNLDAAMVPPVNV